MARAGGILGDLLYCVRKLLGVVFRYWNAAGGTASCRHRSDTILLRSDRQTASLHKADCCSRIWAYMERCVTVTSCHWELLRNTEPFQQSVIQMAEVLSSGLHPVALQLLMNYNSQHTPNNCSFQGILGVVVLQQVGNCWYKGADFQRIGRWVHYWSTTGRLVRRHDTSIQLKNKCLDPHISLWSVWSSKIAPKILCDPQIPTNH